MLKSMTGYGRAQQTIEGKDILVEIKSVNHRYFEFSARTPRAYGYLDDKLKTLANSSISRGKVEMSVSIFTVEGKDTAVELNVELVRGYISALRAIQQEMNLRDDLSLSSVTRFQDVFQVTKTAEDEDAVWNSVSQVAQEAVERFVSMRMIEGERMVADISARLDSIGESVERVEEQSPKTQAAYRERLYGKLKEILEGKNIDEQRVLTEVAIFADKIAVDEETVRLKSHLRQFRQLIASAEPVGRKLDFLVQEMNREVNTIGSKCQDVEITNLVLGMKAEIEKIREQIQNIE